MESIITEPGIYDLSAAAYHDDPLPAASLSAHIAHVLLAESPAHARQAHPKLSPRFEREEKEIFDLGTAAHAYLLEGETGFVIVDAEDWRTKAAREARDLARLEGKVPLLKHRWAEIVEMAEAANRQLDAHAIEDGPRCFSDGKAEQTMVWREGDVWCRARMDWLRDDRLVIDDYKSTGASAHPEHWIRTLYQIGADVQEAFYRRGIKALTGREPIFRFVVQENFAPYALSVISLDPGAKIIADRKVERAIDEFGLCLSSGHWPAYPTRTCHIAIPPWQEASWITREEREILGAL